MPTIVSLVEMFIDKYGSYSISLFILLVVIFSLYKLVRYLFGAIDKLLQRHDKEKIEMVAKAQEYADKQAELYRQQNDKIIEVCSSVVTVVSEVKGVIQSCTK